MDNKKAFKEANKLMDIFLKSMKPPGKLDCFNFLIPYSLFLFLIFYSLFRMPYSFCLETL